MKSTLLSLVDDRNALIALGGSGEIEDRKAFLDTLEAIDGEIDAKADGYYAVIKRLEARQKLLEEESKACADAAKTIKGNIDQMKLRIMGAMTEMGVAEIGTGLHRFKIVNNGGVLPLDICGTVPEEYQRREIVVKDDNEKIRAALDAGKELDFARYKERGKRLKMQ